MTLYEINNAILSCVDMDTGEIIDESALSALEMARGEKIENISLWIKNLRAEASAIKSEEDSLRKRRKACENKSKSLENYLVTALNGERFKTARVSISYRKSESVEVTDITKLDDDYLNFADPTVDKIKVKEALKKGIPLKGVKLVEKQNIQIK